MCVGCMYVCMCVYLCVIFMRVIFTLHCSITMLSCGILASGVIRPPHGPGGGVRYGLTGYRPKETLMML